MIRKVKGGWVVMHCHKGRYNRINATKTPVSYSKALSIHRAIMVSKHGTPRRK